MIGDYIRGIAEMVCKQEERCSIFFEVLAGSGHNQKDREDLTESPFPEQGVCILEGRRLPPCFTEVIRQKTLRGTLFAMPMSDAPKTLKNVLLSKGEIVKGAINGVSLLSLAILIPSNDFKLRFLR